MGLVVAELFTRLLLRVSPYVRSQLAQLGPAGHRLETLELYGNREHRSADTPLGWQHSDPLLPDPRFGWINAPNEQATTPWSFHINAQGMRATHEYPIEKRPGVTRIAVLGDSYAFGYEVDDGETYAALLERGLPDSEVLNLGVAAYGLDQVLLRYEEDFSRYKPDVVVITLVSILLLRCSDTFGAWYKPYFMLEGGELVLHGRPVPSLVDMHRRYLFTPRLYSIYDIAAETWHLRFPSTPSRDDSPLHRRILHRLVQRIHADGARPIILLAPAYWEYGKRSGAVDAYQAVCAANEAECVDVQPRFAEAQKTGLLGDAVGAHHWNIAGNRLVAEEVIDYLKAHPTAPLQR